MVQTGRLNLDGVSYSGKHDMFDFATDRPECVEVGQFAGTTPNAPSDVPYDAEKDKSRRDKK